MVAWSLSRQTEGRGGRIAGTPQATNTRNWQFRGSNSPNCISLDHKGRPEEHGEDMKQEEKMQAPCNQNCNTCLKQYMNVNL